MRSPDLTVTCQGRQMIFSADKGKTRTWGKGSSIISMHTLLERDFPEAAVILQSGSSGLSGDAKDMQIIKGFGSTIERQACFHYYYC